MHTEKIKSKPWIRIERHGLMSVGGSTIPDFKFSQIIKSQNAHSDVFSNADTNEFLFKVSSLRNATEKESEEIFEEIINELEKI